MGAVLRLCVNFQEQGNLILALPTQIRVIDLPGAAEQAAESQLQFQREDVSFPDQETSDKALLKEMVQNRLLSESWVAARGLIGGWNLAELMLRAYVEPQKWEGSDQYRSSLGIPILAENFYSSLSAFTQTLFGGYRPFMIEPGANTKLETADAHEQLVGAQLKTAGPKNTNAKQEIRALAYDGLLYGTGALLVGWQEKTIKKRVCKYKNTVTSIPNGSGHLIDIHGNEDDYEETIETIFINQPVCEHIPLRRLRVAPDCRRADIRTASWRGRIIYLSSTELDTLRDCEGYNIPTREQLISLTTPQKQDQTNNVLDTQGGMGANPLQQSSTTPNKAQPEYMAMQNNVDPLAQKFEIFEYITDNRIGWALENQYCIRNTENNDDVEILSFNFREAPDSFYGYGMAMWVTDFQRIAQGITNAFFDDLALNLMGTYTSEKGANNQSQNAWIFPGKVFKTDGPKGLQPMTRNSVGTEPLAIVEQVKTWASSITGAGARTQGINPGKPGDMRTGDGVQALTAGEETKMQDLVDQACELVFIPLLEYFAEHNQRLKPSQLRAMLTEQLGQDFKGDPIDIKNGSYKISISAGAKLQARKSLNQSIGYWQTVLQQTTLSDQLAQQGKKIDYVEFFGSILKSTGYPYEAQLVVDMTDQEKQAYAAQQQSPKGKLADKLTEIQAAGTVKKDVDNSQAENRALLKTQEHMFELSDKATTGTQ